MPGPQEGAPFALDLSPLRDLHTVPLAIMASTTMTVCAMSVRAEAARPAKPSVMAAPLRVLKGISVGATQRMTSHSMQLLLRGVPKPGAGGYHLDGALMHTALTAADPVRCDCCLQWNHDLFEMNPQ